MFNITLQEGTSMILSWINACCRLMVLVCCRTRIQCATQQRIGRCRFRGGQTWMEKVENIWTGRQCKASKEKTHYKSWSKPKGRIEIHKHDVLTVHLISFMIYFVAMNLLIYDSCFTNQHNSTPARSRQTWAQLSTDLLIWGEAPRNNFAIDFTDVMVLLYMPVLFHPHLLDILAWLPC